MQRVYDELKTPHKFGPVLMPNKGEMYDCPTVFRHNEKWWMVFVSIEDKVGYETRLATSDDLLDWKIVGTILSKGQPGWDQWQADGGIALFDTTWGGTNAIGQHDGKYWLSYFGGNKQGYEPDPLSIGLAWTTDPTNPEPWTRLAENPVMQPSDDEARPFEQKTLYKSFIFHDAVRTLGEPFVMFYNAKQPGQWIERIGIAVSSDLRKWTRYGAGPVVENLPTKPKGASISGDPQLIRMGDLWVMVYFGAGWGKQAFDTFAVSHDLVNWTKWTGPNLIEPSEPFDETYAHKPWLLKHDGVVYHFYCCVGDKGRTIAVATSQPLR